MFCQNCGMRNDENALFCENCGCALENHRNTMAMYVQKKPVSKLALVLIAEIIAVVLAVYGITYAAGKVFSAENTAEAFFVDMANGDMADAYKKLNIKESQFINRKMFLKACRYNNFGVVSDYSIKSQNVSGSVVNVTVEYKSEEQDKGTLDLLLKKGKDKKYSVFDNWCVDMGNFITTYNIIVPEDASVVVDEIELGKKYRGKVEKGMVQYEIPYIFKGMHDIRVYQDGMENVEKQVWLFDSYSDYYLDKMELKEDTCEELINQSVDNMQQIYAAAMSGSSFSQIEDLFISDEESRSNIEKLYEDMVSDMSDEDCKPYKISFKNVTGKAAAYGTYVDVEFDYVMEYVRKSRDGEKTEKKKSRLIKSRNLRFEFVKEDGKWVQENLGCCALSDI